ncbi:hypothetical protein Goklo_025158 [Gossypium klotzschianum]|uniref:Uncharacterized protein n=1 Tax=Gossypium klotzschianum TaxID=34286 RepID=A0A7J8W5S7_9ROSI|nr:hypothetical protein [Gossypium klotzschianum]
MEKGFLDRVEDNAAFRTWAKMTKREKYRQASVSSSCPVLEPGLQLLHIWEGQFGAYNRRIHGFTSMFEDSSGQSLLQSCKCTDLFEEDLILAHPDVMKKVDIFTLSIYGLVVFPRHWDMLTRQSLTYLISLIREFHQSRLIKFHTGSSLKVIHH